MTLCLRVYERNEWDGIDRNKIENNGMEMKWIIYLALSCLNVSKQVDSLIKKRKKKMNGMESNRLLD